MLAYKRPYTVCTHCTAVYRLFVDELVQQATDAGMIVNGWKTKDLLIGPVLKDPPPSVSLSGTPVERVTVFQLLQGVHVASDLKWLQQCRRHHIEGGLETALP